MRESLSAKTVDMYTKKEDLDRMTNKLLIADLFCGAGGSSTGAVKAVRELHREVTLVCVNHWPIAIETHKRNHPEARHYIEDIEKADPYKIVPEGYLDLLMASPECRYFSRARGDKAINDQQRSTAWKVLDWLTKLDVRCILIENVPEFADWGPLDLETNRPIQNKKGQYFQAFVKTLRGIGYRSIEWRFLNAADYGDATTRTRFFLMARKDRKPIQWPEPTHSVTGESDMFGCLPKWRAAREIIDWSNPGRSLLDDPRYQKRPLSEKTLKRIARGLEKFGGELAPLYIQLLGLATGQNVTECHSPEPFVMGKQSKPSYRGVDEPVHTITTQDTPHLIEPVIEPFVMGKQGHSPAYRKSGEPMMTITAEGRPVLVEPVAKPFLVQNRIRPDGDRVYDIDKPMQTVTSHGAGALVNPLMVKYYGGDDCSDIDAPVPTVTTKDRFGLVTPTANPFLVECNHSGDNNRSYTTERPLKTITTNRYSTALIEPTINCPVCPDCGGVCSLDHNSFQCDSCKKLWPLSYPHINIDPRRLVLINGEPYCLDIRFRMLDNLELARAMGFTDTESTYEFTGTKTDITRQIGNAVPVNLAKALVKTILE